MRIMKQKRGQFIIIAALIVAIMMVSISITMYGAITYFKHERWEEYLAIIDNIKLGSYRVVEISLANYTSTLNNETLRYNLNQWANDVKRAYAGFGVILSGSGTATLSQTLCAHQETAPISGTYYLLKNQSADASGTNLSNSTESTGRQLLGKFVYLLTGITSIPANTWRFYYRAWHSTVPAENSTNSPSSTPAGTWTNPTYGYSSDDLYATTSTDDAKQQYGNYSFNVPSGATINKVEVGFEAYTDENEEIGITCSWDNGTTWATEYKSGLPKSDPNTVTWVDFTTATNWTVDKLSDANFRTQAKGIAKGKMSTVYLDCIPVRVTYTVPPSAHMDVDISILKSDGTIRQTIATGVADSGALTATAQTLSGTYSWPSYTDINPTDYLEIDYYVHVTTAKAGATAYLRIDDNTLPAADQTRIANIIFPSEGDKDEAGLTIEWDNQQGFSAANAAFILNITSVGLSGYRFFIPVFLGINIFETAWDNNQKELKISLAVDREGAIPVTDLKKNNFSIYINGTKIIEDDFTLVRSYSEKYDSGRFIYEIYCTLKPSDNPPFDVSVKVVDTRGIIVKAKTLVTK